MGVVFSLVINRNTSHISAGLAYWLIKMIVMAQTEQIKMLRS